MKKHFLALALIAFCALAVCAQRPIDEDDTQSWNDVQLTVPINKQVDFTTWGTFRFGKNITWLQDRRVAVGIVYKPLKFLSFQPFYWNIVARNSSGKFKQEHRLSLRATYRFPFKSFGLSHRSQFEWRIRKPRNSWRWRPSLTFEKDFPKKFFVSDLKFFATEEVFYDSILNKFSRNRFSIGVTKKINKKLSVDVYYMRQNDGFSIPGDLNVIGTSWKIKL